MDLISQDSLSLKQREKLSMLELLQLKMRHGYEVNLACVWSGQSSATSLWNCYFWCGRLGFVTAATPAATPSSSVQLPPPADHLQHSLHSLFDRLSWLTFLHLFPEPFHSLLSPTMTVSCRFLISVCLWLSGTPPVPALARDPAHLYPCYGLSPKVWTLSPEPLFNLC